MAKYLRDDLKNSSRILKLLGNALLLIIGLLLVAVLGLVIYITLNQEDTINRYNNDKTFRITGNQSSQ